MNRRRKVHRATACLCTFLTLGCGIDARSELEVLYAPAATAPLETVTILLDGPGLDRQFDGSDLGTSRYGTPHTPVLDVEPGMLTVTVRIAGAGELLAEAVVSIPIEAERRYGVAAIVAAERPTYLGRMGGAAVGVRGTATDSLFVSWGSNSLPEPVIY